MTREEATPHPLETAHRVLPREPRRALDLATRAGEDAMSRGDHGEAGEAWRVVGRALKWLERHDEAVTAYQRSRAEFLAASDRIGAARTDIGWVDALMYMDRFEEASRVGRRALGVFLDEDQPVPAGRLLMNLGNLEYRRDRPQAALDRYRRARALLEGKAPDMDVAFADFNIANILVQTGDLETADTLYAAVRRTARAEGNTLVVLHTDYAVAGLDVSRLRIREGLQGLLECETRFKEMGHERGRLNCRLDRAEAYQTLHLTGEASHFAEAAHEGFQELELRMEAARALAVAGVADLQGEDAKRGRQRIAQAARLLAALGNQPLADRLRLRLAETGRAGADPQELHAMRARFRAEGQSVWASEVCLELARRALSRRDLTGARRWVRAARADAGRTAPPSIRSRAYHLLGLIEERAGRLSEARLMLRHALRGVAGVRAALGSEDLVQAHLRWARDLHRDSLRMAVALGAGANELFRSALITELGEVARSAASWSDPELETLRSRWATLTESDRRLLPERPDTSVAHRRRVAQLEREIEERVRHIRLTTPSTAGTQDWKLRDLQECLGESELWIHWVPTGRRVVPLVIRRDRARSLGFGVDETRVESLREELRFQMERILVDPGFTERRRMSMARTTEDVLNRLGELILAGWEDQLDGVRRILIRPPEGWESIPWGALCVQGRPLWEGHEVVVTPSVGHFLEHRRHRRRRPRGSAQFWGVSDEDALQAEHEAASLAGAMPRSKVFVGEEATRAAFLRSVPTARHLHFAGHGRFRPDSPAFSSLQFSDGDLVFLDLESVRLVAELVVLSACETGRSWGGTEGTGLARGFLRAGAQRLLLTHWRIPDKGAERLLGPVYDELSRGTSPSEALRRAALQSRADGDHPAVWGAFHLVGMP